VRAKEQVDAGEKERVQEGPVRCGRLCRGERVPAGGEGKAVPLGHADGQSMIGALVGEQRRSIDDVAEVKRHADADRDGE